MLHVLHSACECKRMGDTALMPEAEQSQSQSR